MDVSRGNEGEARPTGGRPGRKLFVLMLTADERSFEASLAEVPAEGSGQAAAEGGGFVIQAESYGEFKAQLLARLEERFTGGPAIGRPTCKYAALVETVQGLVQENYRDANLCLTSLAGMVRLSARHLSRVYKEHTGRSLPDYVNGVRMQKAAEMLENTSLNVGAVAAGVGIWNETYFYSMFKKYYGTSPGQYKTLRALERVREGSAG